MRPRIDLPIGELVARYEAGESTRGLATAHNVSRDTIRTRLLETGVEMRPSGGGRPRKHGGQLWQVGKGYLYTRTRDRSNCYIARGCYEAHNGPIPDGYVVHHVNHDILDNAIGNLTCMTWREHGRLHSVA
jgi:hypothetical protein